MMTPPRIPRWLLGRAAPPQDRAALIGDLDEEFRRRDRGAVFWYWRQAFASLPSAVILRWHRAAPFNDLAGDFRRAFRALARRPGFAAAVIATMALGAATTTAVVSIAEAILVRPLPYANADRLIVIQEIDPARRDRSLSWPDVEEMSGQLRTVSAMAGFSGASRTLTGAGPAERVRGVEVTPRLFEVLGVPIAHGRGFRDADTQFGAPRVVILSDRSWRLRFGGDPGAIGRLVGLSGVPHTIVGVLPASFIFPLRGDPEVWMPVREPSAQQPRTQAHFLDVIGVKAAGASDAAVLEELRTRAQIWSRAGQPWHPATSLTAANLRDDIVASVRPALLIVLGAALLVLLASAVNVSGLILTRASARAGELSVRTALGAGRWRIVRELAVEALCIAAAGSACGLLLGAGAVAAFRATTPLRFRSALPFADQLSVSPSAAAFSVAATVIAVLAAGLLPAFRAGRLRNPLVTSTRTTPSAADTRVRRALVAAQIALAVVLLTGVTLIGRSVVNLMRVSPGFAIDGVVAGRVNLPDGRDDTPAKIVAAADRIRASIRAVPGVAGVEIINRLPFGGRNYTGELSIVGRAITGRVDPMLRSVSPDYFRLMGIPVREGRGIQPSDVGSAPRVAVINQALARAAFADQSPIGERIVITTSRGSSQLTIVGVAGDEQFDALDQPMAPVVYSPFAQAPTGEFSLVMRSTSRAPILPAVREALSAVEPDLPLFEVQTLSETAAQSNAMFLRTLVMRLLAWFALATLLLGGVGVYGVLSQAIASRTKEIGLRFALGATRGGIARLVLTTGARPAAMGVLGGLAAAAAAARFLQALLFGVTPLDLLSFAAVVSLLAIVTLAACAAPARRAMRLPISTALRHE
jgi:predicted permease